MPNPLIIESNGKKICLVEMPEDAREIAIHYSNHWTNDDIEKLVFLSSIQDPLKCGGDMIHLPPGSWSILGKGEQLSEEQCKEIVGKEYFEDDSEHWFVYEKGGKIKSDLFYATATESGHSLLASNGFEPNKTLILVSDE